jgi:hypothetical protein
MTKVLVPEETFGMGVELVKLEYFEWAVGRCIEVRKQGMGMTVASVRARRGLVSRGVIGKKDGGSVAETMMEGAMEMDVLRATALMMKDES